MKPRSADKRREERHIVAIVCVETVVIVAIAVSASIVASVAIVMIAVDSISTGQM